MTPEPMTRARATEYAPQWGSYRTPGDPGACMYGLNEKGRPSDAATRDLMVEHIDSNCLPIALRNVDAGELDCMQDTDELEALKAYLQALKFPADEPRHTFDPAPAGGHDVAQFARHYVTAMLWSSTDPDSDDEPLDSRFGPQDLAPDTWRQVESDCRAFLTEMGVLITVENYTGRGSDYLVIAGHDFWLTRVGHGAGFWDGDWRSDAGAKLTVASKRFADCNTYVVADGRIHLS